MLFKLRQQDWGWPTLVLFIKKDVKRRVVVINPTDSEEQNESEFLDTGEQGRLSAG